MSTMETQNLDSIGVSDIMQQARDIDAKEKYFEVKK